MKRGAEKQLSKDDYSDGEGQDNTPQVGFKKADESVLATRKIRGLPKRASVAAIPPPATEFATFSGFNGGSNSFSGFATSTTTLPTNFFSPTIQTNTAKSLTSLLSSSSAVKDLPLTNSTSVFSSASPFATPPATTSLSVPTPASSTPFSTKKDAIADPAGFKYYTSLRGLNQSLHAAVSKAIANDPFADITSFLEQYKSLRADIQKEFDAKIPPSSSSTTTLAPSVPMPAPFEGGPRGMKVPTSTDTKPSTTPSIGFVPTFDTKPKTEKAGGPTPSLPFSFGSKSADTTTATPTLFGTKQPEISKDPSPTSSTLLSNPLSTLTPPDSNSIKSSTPIPLALTNSAKPETPPTSIFGSSSTPSFTFGSSSSSSLASSTKTGDTSAPVTGGKFAGFTGFGTFSKSATTPTDFGFKSSLIVPATAPSLGSGSAKTLSTLTTTASDSSTSGDATAPAASSSADAETSDDTHKGNIAESFILNADNKHDQEGPGEEDEETVHSVKLKAYVMKDEKGAKSWVELGYGVLRIKKRKETEARRVLLRSSVTGQVLINFTFHSAFKPTQKGKNVTFLGHNAESGPRMYTLKLPTQEQATELAAALDREIQAKNASSS